jgi:hypothetical protein
MKKVQLSELEGSYGSGDGSGRGGLSGERRRERDDPGQPREEHGGKTPRDYSVNRLISLNSDTKSSPVRCEKK